MNRSVRASARPAAPVVAVAIVLTACGADHPAVDNRPDGPTQTQRSEPPAPTATVVRHYRTYRAGEAGLLRSPSQHASLRLTAGQPHRSATALSSYGHPPRYGDYVTFRLTIANTGRVPVLIRRLDFWLQTPGTARTTADDGNAPFSGGSRQLDTTQLAAGQQVTNDLTFDVAHPTGTLFYGAGGHRQLAWTF